MSELAPGWPIAHRSQPNNLLRMAASRAVYFA